MDGYVPWLTLALLGAYHGLNPGMGWLFAVARGLQERSRAAVVRAFGPIALGHAASVAVVVAVVGASHTVVPSSLLRVTGAGVLILFGLYKLLAPMSHPRWVGMRVNARDLTAWSFLMSTAHGAGLMLVPVLLRLSADAAPPPALAAHAGHAPYAAHAAHAGYGDHAAHLAAASTSAGVTVANVAAVGVHTIAMFLVMGAIAVVVFERVGLAVLRRAWFNLDRIWAAALIGAGALTFLL
jgi:hypothetical protein